MERETNIIQNLKEKEKQEEQTSQSDDSHGELEISEFLSTIDKKTDYTIESSQDTDDVLENDSTNEKELLFQSSSKLMMYLDTRGRIAKINNAGITFSGFSKEDIIGKRFWMMPGVFTKKNIPQYLQVFKNSLLGKKTKGFIATLNDKSGKTHTMEFSTYPILEQKRIKHILVLAQDITEKKEIGQKFERIFTMSSELICEADINTATFTKINPAFTRVLGYSEKELLSQSFLEFIHPEDKEPTQNVIDEQLQRGEKVLSFINRYRCKDGSYVWLDWNSVPIPEEGILYAVARDITEKKKYEEEMTQSEKKYHTLFDTMAQGVVYQGANGEIISANHAAEQILGLTLSQMQGRTSLDPCWKAVDKDKNILPGEHHPSMVALRTGEKVTDFLQGVFNPKLNDYVWIIVSSTPQFKQGNDTPYQVFSTFLDVTKQIQYEQELKERIKELKGIQQLRKTLEKSNRYDEIFIKFVNDIAPQSMQFHDKTYAMVQFDGKTYTNNPNVHLDEKTCLSESIIINQKERGKIIIGYLEDLPFIEKYEEELIWNYAEIFNNGISKLESNILLKKSENKFRNLIEDIVDVVFELSEDGFVRYISPKIQDVLGYNPDEQLHKHFKDFVCPDDLETAVEGFEYHTNGGRNPVKFRMMKKNGDIIWVSLLGGLTKEGDNNVFRGVFRDITYEKESQLKLNQSRKETDMILNTAGDGIRIVTKDFKIKTMNETLAQLTQTTKEKGIGEKCYNVFNSKDCGTENCSMVKILQTGEGFEKEEIRTTSEGKEIPCMYKATPYIDENGEIIGIIEDFRDISSLLETEARFQNIFENKGTAMGTFGDDGVITLCNSKFEEISGFSKEEVLGKMKWSDFVVKEDLERMMKYHIQRSEGENPTSEYTCDIIDKKGQRKTMIVNIGVMPNSKERIVSLTDITKQKTAEQELMIAHEELKVLNKDLEKKVEERTEDIQRVLEQKDEFVNQLGHDLKNPLGPLLNLLPIIEKRESDPRQKEMLNVINRNVQYMRNLVTKTIQLAQLKSPSTGLKYEQIDLRKEIHEVLSNNRLFFDEHNIDVENLISEPLMIEADTLKLQEVFNNLLNNAVKYSKDGGGTITINQQTNDDSITISIQDDGVGMTAEQLEKVFTEFYKADSSRHDFDSSGLGMPICKRIVELHGGKIWVESEGLGKGSTFCFTLPKNKLE